MGWFSRIFSKKAEKAEPAKRHGKLVHYSIRKKLPVLQVLPSYSSSAFSKLPPSKPVVKAKKKPGASIAMMKSKDMRYPISGYTPMPAIKAKQKALEASPEAWKEKIEKEIQENNETFSEVFPLEEELKLRKKQEHKRPKDFDKIEELEKRIKRAYDNLYATNDKIWSDVFRFSQLYPDVELLPAGADMQRLLRDNPATYGVVTA